MTKVEAIFKSLEQIGKSATVQEITDLIQKNSWCDFSTLTVSKPLNVITAALLRLTQKNNPKIKRYKENSVYCYYLIENKQVNIMQESINVQQKNDNNSKTENYEERDLHKLLSTYLRDSGIYAKTIYHEQSNRKEDNQKWTHPDMIGINFMKFNAKSSEKLLKAINQTETFKVYSYELKREITTDYELKKAFFQTVSNSSWANYGYLVALKIDNQIKDELERLNQSFGIGVILLSTNPFQSKILFPAKYKNIDIKTIDKLCMINPDFKKFIDLTEKYLTAEERFIKLAEKELSEEFCDGYFKDEIEAKKYCKDKNIPGGGS